MKERSKPSHTLSRIVSGGQTGVDRAALDAAIWLGIPHGGWCPKHRRSETGTIPAQYQLQETAETSYPVRTERNVIESDATLILYWRQLQGGTAYTVRMAEKHQRPHLLLDLSQPIDYAQISDWIACEAIETLNVAGPRESSHPGIGDHARQVLIDIFRDSS